ncbi:MAG TPA: hypothetical protein DIC60_06880 [Lachnospiraceae bacterium]|nr:hypothetical protein [Lachnospiraceae bacterium]
MKEMMILKTMQPYFVLGTTAFVQRIVFENGISHFFEFTIDNEKDVFVIPDGCINFIFEYDSQEMKAYIIASHLKKMTFKARKGITYFGARLMPGEFPLLFAKNIASNCLDLKYVVGMENLYNAMKKTEGFDNRILKFTQEYNRINHKMPKKENAQMLFQTTKNIIIEEQGSIKVKELEEITKYSSRYLSRVFADSIGMSTKQFCDIVKFQTILFRMKQGEVENLTSLAMEFQYFDQSHFTRDFKNLLGISPKPYYKMITNSHFEDKIINC